MRSLARLWFVLAISLAYAQRPVQVSGVVLGADGDSVVPLAFAHIINISRQEGTLSRIDGYFALPAYAGDTIQVRYIGYRTHQFIVPDTPRWFVQVVLQPDTYQLQEAVVYPWPSPSQFKQAVLNLQLPKAPYEEALSQEVLNRLAYEGPVSPELAQAQTFSAHTMQFYYYKQLPSSVGNLWAWAKFFQWLQQRKRRR